MSAASATKATRATKTASATEPQTALTDIKAPDIQTDPTADSDPQREPKREPKCEVEARPKEPVLQPREVIHRERFYSPAQIHALLGIPVERTIAAFNADGVLVADFQLRGDDILKWVAKQAIHCTPKPAPEPSATPDRGAALISEARTTLKEIGKLDQAERDAARQGLENDYADILLRADSPKDSDASTLAIVSEELGIDAARMEDDLRIVRRARRQAEFHEGLEAAKGQWTAARDARRKLEQTHEVQMRAALRTESTAENQHRLGQRAANELRELRKQCPILFDGNCDPPRLREPQPEPIDL